MIDSVIILLFSLLLDRWLGEPRHYHPLVGFGLLANRLEQFLNKGQYRFIKGLLAVSLLIVPVFLISTYIPDQGLAGFLFSSIIVYFCIGAKSLRQHAKAVYTPLNNHDVLKARHSLSMMVSRDTANLDHRAIAKATVESVAENSNDAIFGAITWFIIAGIPGIIIYRLVNTLDAMWGYKNTRFINFGRAAARLDDILNWLPARLTVLTVAVSGQYSKIINNARTQGLACASFNGGPVMAAVATRLGITLGGSAYYQNQLIEKPVLGEGRQVTADDIITALRLVDTLLIIWLVVLFIIAIVLKLFL